MPANTPESLLSMPCTREASRELDRWLVAIEADRQRQREGM
jgi:hypothetical protein